MKHWAVEAYIGMWDGYVHNVNNYYLHNHVADGFRFIP